MIGLPFTVYCLPHALRSALSALRQEGSAKPGLLGPECFLSQPVTPPNLSDHLENTYDVIILVSKRSSQMGSKRLSDNLKTPSPLTGEGWGGGEKNNCMEGKVSCRTAHQRRLP